MIDFGSLILAHLVGDYVLQNDWQAQNKTRYHVPCIVHVLLYTLAFVVIVEASGGWPTWAYGAIAATHYPVDRYGLAGRWMRNVSGQKGFADGMGPWSIIVVDNTFHLICAFIVMRMSD